MVLDENFVGFFGKFFLGFFVWLGFGVDVLNDNKEDKSRERVIILDLWWLGLSFLRLGCC
jgi:hypothetical protein